MSDKDVPKKTTQPVKLNLNHRLISGAVATLFGLAAIAITTFPIRVFEAAPVCTDAPAGCVVSVSSPPDPAITIALIAGAAIFALLCATGRLWTFKTSFLETSPAGEEVDVVPPGAVDGEMGPLSGLTEVPSTPDATAREVLYASIPVDVRQAADTQWSEWYPGRALVQDLIDVPGRSPGQGNKPYYIRMIEPTSKSIIVLRISKGGQGKRVPTVSQE
jgi:hypothetical protein